MTQTKTWIYQCFLDCPKMSFWSLLSLNCCHLFKIYTITSWGDTHMTSTLRGVGYKAKARCYRSLGLGLASVLDDQSFFIKDNRIFAMTRRVKHWQEIFLLTLESECIHPSMIPLHCLWPKSNNRTRGQFECDVTWFCFCFDFVRLH